MSSSIENEFQPPEWATKEEVIKAARHYINYWKVEAQTRNGQWLSTLADYARLKAEVERLRITEQNQTDRVISLEDCIQVLKQDRDGLLYEESEQVKRLKAEVERLTKAGDAFVLLLEDEGYDMESIREVDGWNAAKEGKPRA